MRFVPERSISSIDFEAPNTPVFTVAASSDVIEKVFVEHFLPLCLGYLRPAQLAIPRQESDP